MKKINKTKTEALVISTGIKAGFWAVFGAGMGNLQYSPTAPNSAPIPAAPK